MEDDEFHKRAARINELYKLTTITTPVKNALIKNLLNPGAEVDLLGKVSTQYGDQVIMDRTKVTALTKKSLMTSLKSVANEIFVNISFKFVKMVKNKRVYADMLIQPYVNYY